jgi:hypothetical protein
MRSAEGAGHKLSEKMIAKVQAHDLSTMRAGGGGEVTRFVCGFMSCDPLLCRPILLSLPAAFKVNLRTDRSGHWLENSVLHLADEASSGHAGSEAVLAKLSEALFVDTLRRYLSGLPQQKSGWLAGARDPIVGKSLMLLHSRIQHPWTIAELAREVGTLALEPGGTVHPISFRATDGLSDSLAAATGSAGPGLDLSRRRRDRR